MNEAEAHVLRDIIRTTIREAIAAEIGPLSAALDKLSGLPKYVDDLTGEVLKLRAAVEELSPRVERHTDELRGVARALREVEPTVEKLSIIVGETVPELVRRMDNITDHLQRRGMLGEIDRESQRAAGEKA